MKKTSFALIIAGILVFAPVYSHGSATNGGESLFVITTGFLGVSLYGLGVPFLLMPWSSGDFASMAFLSSMAYLGIGGGSIAWSYQTSLAGIGESRALAYSFGAALGFLDGLALYTLAAGPDGFREFGGGKVCVSTLIASTLAASIGGYYSASPLALSPEDAFFMGAAGFYGILLGLDTGLGFAPSITERSMNGIRLPAGFSLLGGTFFPAAAWYLSRLERVTGGDLLHLVSATLIGSSAGVAIATLIDDSDPALCLLSGAAGSVAGAVGGWLLQSGRDFNDSDGGLALLGGLSGAVFGLGLAMLCDFDDIAFYTCLSTLGAAAGYGLVYAGQYNQPGKLTRPQNAVIPGDGSTAVLAMALGGLGAAAARTGFHALVDQRLPKGFSAELLPENLLSLFLPDPDTSVPTASAPVLTATCRF